MVVYQRWMLDLERLFRQFDHAHRVMPGMFSLAAFSCILACRMHKKALDWEAKLSILWCFCCFYGDELGLLSARS